LVPVVVVVVVVVVVLQNGEVIATNALLALE
jgi:hypothetical protein